MILRPLALFLVTIIWAGCVSPRSASTVKQRDFRFSQDTFAFANELVWTYQIDPLTGRTKAHRRTPPPEYSLHCFTMVRSARQFCEYARFDPNQPQSDSEAYRRLVREIAKANPCSKIDDMSKILVPGFSNLYEFSHAYELLLKRHCGSAWQSYFQRGNWRMVFPFTAGHQLRTADQLTHSLEASRFPIVHVVRFPRLSINHALLLFDFSQTEHEIQFLAYDPNQPARPLLLKFNRDDRTFYYPATDYFAGGRVKVYEIYNGLLY